MDLSGAVGDLRITGRGDGAPAPPGVGMADELGTSLAAADLNFMPPPSFFVQFGGGPLPAQLDLWRDQADVAVRSDRGTVNFATAGALAVGDVSGSGTADMVIGDGGSDGPGG